MVISVCITKLEFILILISKTFSVYILTIKKSFFTSSLKLVHFLILKAYLFKKKLLKVWLVQNKNVTKKLKFNLKLTYKLN